jgi:carbon-monoxide dehydrogenase small subunit
LDILRDNLGLTGTKEGCGVGECGACTVIINGKAVCSCITLAAGLNGAEVTTIEGLSKNGELDVIQQAILDHHALQCGFCTPGIVMSAKALLDANPHPTTQQIKEAIAGNLCRCTGYQQVIEAVADAARRRAEQESK